MLWLRVSLAVALIASALPFVAADAGDGCLVQNDPSAVDVVGTFYIKRNVQVMPIWASTVWIYQESNGAAGLQTSPSPCGWGNPMLPPDLLSAVVSGVIPL